MCLYACMYVPHMQVPRVDTFCFLQEQSKVKQAGAGASMKKHMGRKKVYERIEQFFFFFFEMVLGKKRIHTLRVLSMHK